MNESEYHPQIEDSFILDRFHQSMEAKFCKFFNNEEFGKDFYNATRSIIGLAFITGSLRCGAELLDNTFPSYIGAAVDCLSTTASCADSMLNALRTNNISEITIMDTSKNIGLSLISGSLMLTGILTAMYDYNKIKPNPNSMSYLESYIRVTFPICNKLSKY